MLKWLSSLLRLWQQYTRLRASLLKLKKAEADLERQRQLLDQPQRQMLGPKPKTPVKRDDLPPKAARRIDSPTRPVKRIDSPRTVKRISPTAVQTEAMLALKSLGWKKADAESRVMKVSTAEETDAAQIVVRALRK